MSNFKEKAYEMLTAILFGLIVVVSIQTIKCTPKVPPPPSDYIDEVDMSNFV